MRVGVIWAAVAAFAIVVVSTGTAGASGAAGIVPTHLPYPAGGTNVQGVGVDANDDNAQLADDVGARLVAGWQAQPPLCPQAGDDAPVSISVAGSRTVVSESQYQCTYLSAYATNTGALLWRHEFDEAGNYEANIVGSLVYEEYDEPEGQTVLRAYDLDTGALRWTSFDGDYYGQNSNTIGSGVVVNELWADNAATGKHVYTARLQAGGETDGTSFLAGGRLFDNDYSSVQAFNATTGAALWVHRKATDSGSDNEPSLHDGLLYARDATTLVLNPATGALVRTLPASTEPIAFDNGVGFFSTTPLNAPATVSAVDLATGSVYWTHTFPRVVIDKYGDTEPTALWAAPLVEDGLVWLYTGIDTGTPAKIVALNERTGAVDSTTTEKCDATLGELTVAQHRLFATSNCGLLTYTG